MESVCRKSWYHDLYIQSDTLLLADVFENFKDKCIDICELDPAHFLSVPASLFRKGRGKIRVINK